MPKPDPIGIDPQSPQFDDVDAAARAFAATFPNNGNETAGMLYKAADGKFRYSTTIPGTDDNFVLRALVPKESSLAGIVHSHPGKDALGQYFSANDLATADQLKLPSYVRFLDGDQVRVYRPGVTKTEHVPMSGSRFEQTVARGDELAPIKAQIAQLLAQNPVTP